jgi:hypothetical protein
LRAIHSKASTATFEENGSDRNETSKATQIGIRLLLSQLNLTTELTLCFGSSTSCQRVELT